MDKSSPFPQSLSMDICMVILVQFFTSELHHENSCLCHMWTTFGADQPAHPCSLISTFVVCCLDSIISLVSMSEISSLTSYYGCAGRFVSYLVANPEDRFSRDEAQIIWTKKPVKEIRRVSDDKIIFHIFSQKNVCYGYSLELLW